jgi:hypothetical protein
MNALDQKTTHSILKEINALLEQGILPIHNDHLISLAEDGNILEWLISLKDQGLISGDLIRIGVDGRPHGVTNIRLTYIGLRALRL